MIRQLQSNLSRADTYGTDTFVHFREASALERFELKSSQFKVQLFYTGPTLTWTPLPPYLTMVMWNGEKEVCFFCNVSVYLALKVKVVSFFLLLSISDHNFLQLFSYHLQ